jgi:hypothetical protein
MWSARIELGANTPSPFGYSPTLRAREKDVFSLAAGGGVRQSREGVFALAPT